MSVTEEAETIVEQFNNHGAEIEQADVQSRLVELVEEYKVPLEEAVNSVESQLFEETPVAEGEYYGDSESELLEMGNLAQYGDEYWGDARVQVVELWEPNSDAVGQVGLVGDETGTAKFTAWAKSDLPTLEEGESYLLENVVTDEYRGNYSFKLNGATDVTHLDETVEVGDQSVSIDGMLVDIQDGSGLIRRCSEDDCSRTLRNGRCSEHGEVEGEFDMRIKGVIDDGQTAYDVVVGRELTEELGGISVSEAKQIAMDSLDTEVISDQLEAKLIGRYVEVEAAPIGDTHVANEISIADPSGLEDALERAEAMQAQQS
ncbi:replication factor A1 [Halorientalis persicus]|uniref:Replication factor A1 n=1 Tax=Halorientalis persicus TaxID=1367881 RepID=A0A1H8WCU5_9EURY|nr:hypothetical protein [Halorientalis persicus]SEP25460.1 replication factor A1 [Halorientalis persicus]